MRKRFAVLQGIVLVLLVVSALGPATFSLASEGSQQASVAEGTGSPAGSGSGGSSASVSPLAVVPAAGSPVASGVGSGGGPALAAQSSSDSGSGSGSASGGVPALYPQSTTITMDADGEPTGTSGDGWSYDGTTLVITGDVTVGGNTCTCAVQVVAGGTISGGTFDGAIENHGTISGGTFKFDVRNNYGASITGGTVYWPIQHAGGTVSAGSGLLWGVTRSLANVTSDGTATTVASDATLTEHLTAATGYALPQTVAVTLDGVAATAGTDYTWDPATGTLTIRPAADQAKMGPIAITVEGTITSHSLTVAYDGPSDGTFVAPARHVGDVVYGTAYSVTSPDVAGYTPDRAAVEGTMGTSDVSETVTYAANTYTVAFDSNGGTGSMAPMAFAYGTAQDLTACGFTAPAGHHFAGWAASADDAAAGTVAYADGASVGNLATAQDAVVTLFAVWVESDPVTITYASGNAAMGTVSPASESVAPATGTATGSTATAKVGYRFVNWTAPSEMRPGSAPATQSDTVAGTDPTLTPAQVDAVAKASGAYVATTFTANFEPITYTVAFEADGGTGSMTPMTLAYGTAQDLTACGFTAPAGHHFAGWAASAADAAAGTVAYADGASVTNLATAQDAVVTLYAVWTESDPVTITYVSGSTAMGTVSPASESVAPATGTATGSTATAKVGYRFVNWTVPDGMHTNSVDGQAAGSALATQSDTVAGTDPTLTPAQVDAVAKASGAYVATTFTANFEPITYTVAYNANGGSGTMSPTTLAYGTAGTLAANAFTREGHTFSGWNTMPDGTGTSYADGASVNDLATVQDATVTLYAQWTFVSTPTPTNPTTKPDVLAKTGDVAGPVALGLIAIAVAGAALLVVRRRRA